MGQGRKTRFVATGSTTPSHERGDPALVPYREARFPCQAQPLAPGQEVDEAGAEGQEVAQVPQVLDEHHPAVRREAPGDLAEETEPGLRPAQRYLVTVSGIGYALRSEPGGEVA